ncbi:hypothetical protein [Bacteroides muris (ex Afrizal et al. 2022)]|uniref:hypothetical protein n=1 Tax=Bacteroides muris (ex Afrizal et al. 2022) TaxID=2516960 RepID=UPI0014428D72|nr:hypothetical protein [Bacteroides muris (ex Afrizal et al. 2022)]
MDKDIAVAVSVYSDTDRPGFYRQNALPASSNAWYRVQLSPSLMGDLPPLSGGHRLIKPGLDIVVS